MSNIQPILDKALAGERMTAEDGTALLESQTTSRESARRLMKSDSGKIRPKVVTYIIDRNINYTNVCNVVCTFCAFYRRPGKPDTYVHSFEEICKRIDETIALGGTGVLMQGGLHPDFNIEWYEDLAFAAPRALSEFSAPLFFTARNSQYLVNLEIGLRNNYAAT